MIQGDSKGVFDNKPSITDLVSNIARSLYAYAIPAIWYASGTNPFILDSGYDCDDAGALTTVSPEDMAVSGACVNNKQYYLVQPKGDTSVCEWNCVDGSCMKDCSPAPFTLPPGIDALTNNSEFGHLTVNDFITGAVTTYNQNGQLNGGPALNPIDMSVFDDLSKVDVTRVAGYIRIPVCSGDVAYAAWNTGQSTNQTISPNYPCFVGVGRNDCGTSTFVGATSSGSPLIDDCRVIIKNIQGTQGEWTFDNVFGTQKAGPSWGTCTFGAQGEDANGSAAFYIGAQDIIDLINSAIEQFGSNGLVGASGTMTCRGNINQVPDVLWGIYHS